MEHLPEYDRNSMYYVSPKSAKEKLLERLLRFPIILSVCILGYSVIGEKSLLTTKMAVILFLIIFLPFSYFIMFTFYFLVGFIRFVVLKHPVTNFYLRISYYPFVFGGWYWFISVISPASRSLKLLFERVWVNNAPCLLFMFLAISIFVLSILLKSHLLILSYDKNNYDNTEIFMPSSEKICVYALLLCTNLALVLF